VKTSDLNLIFSHIIECIQPVARCVTSGYDISVSAAYSVISCIEQQECPKWDFLYNHICCTSKGSTEVSPVHCQVQMSISSEGLHAAVSSVRFRSAYVVQACNVY
jgi:hypothetical protein